MSIEDIMQLKKNSIKQTYICLIDSKNRDFNLYPDPNNYVVNFDVPIKNVIGFDIIDTSMPRTMYSVDKYNNSFYYYIHTDTNIDSFNEVIKNIDISINDDPTYNGFFTKHKITPRDYNTQTFITYFNDEFNDGKNDYNLYVSCLSMPTQLTDVIQIYYKYE